MIVTSAYVKRIERSKKKKKKRHTQQIFTVFIAWLSVCSKLFTLFALLHGVFRSDPIQESMPDEMMFFLRLIFYLSNWNCQSIYCHHHCNRDEQVKMCSFRFTMAICKAHTLPPVGILSINTKLLGDLHLFWFELRGRIQTQKKLFFKFSTEILFLRVLDDFNTFATKNSFRTVLSEFIQKKNVLGRTKCHIKQGSDVRASVRWSPQFEPISIWR